MAKNPAYPMYAQDFDMDTASWPALAIGIYVRLLNYSWINGAIPTDTKRLSRIARVDHGNFKKTWDRYVKGKWTENGKGFLNNRMEVEREKRNNYIEKQRKKGRASAEKRWGSVTTVKPRLQPEDKPEGNSSLSSSITTKKHSQQTPVDPCPHQEIIDLYHETLPELQGIKIWSEKRMKLLKARWREDPKRQNLDYWKRLFGYIRKSPFLMGENDRHWTADLEWILTKNKFIKIIEGKYHKSE